MLVGLLAATVPFLGRYMADVYGARDDGSAPGDRFFGPIERTIYRICGIDAKREQRWNVYATSLLAFSLVSVLVLYAMHRLQGVLPFNPTDRPGVSADGLVQRRDQLRHQHELAVVLGRGHHQPPHQHARATRSRTSCRRPPGWSS